MDACVKLTAFLRPPQPDDLPTHLRVADKPHAISETDNSIASALAHVTFSIHFQSAYLSPVWRRCVYRCRLDQLR